MLYNDDEGFVGTPYPLYSRLPFFRLTCGGWGEANQRFLLTHAQFPYTQ